MQQGVDGTGDWDAGGAIGSTDGSSSPGRGTIGSSSSSGALTATTSSGANGTTASMEGSGSTGGGSSGSVACAGQGALAPGLSCTLADGSMRGNFLGPGVLNQPSLVARLSDGTILAGGASDASGSRKAKRK